MLPCVMNYYQKDFILIKRKLKSGRIIYYYRLAGEKTHHSTGKRLKWEAEDYVKKEVLPKLKQSQTLREYLEPYFTEKCPHVSRLRDENKSISKTYISDMRTRMEKYIFPDAICKSPFDELKRAHILDFRSRLLAKGVGVRTVNRTIGVLKIACKEAYFREEADRDPTAGIGEIKYDKRLTGTFTKNELKSIFSARPGVWGDLVGYTVFLLAAHTGMRRGEVLELTWKQVDFDGRLVKVDRARTDNQLPKFDKIRATPISKMCVEAFKALRASSHWVLPDQLVFCYEDGKPLGFTWWKTRFRSAMVAAGLVTKERISVGEGENAKQKTIYHNPRGLKPHSLRHSINTILRDAGYDAGKIRAAMGWSDEKVQEGYTDWQSMDFSSQRDIIERELG